MNREADNEGFTLVELLVAVGITAVLAAVLLAVTRSTLELWRRAQDNFTTDTQALLMLDYLERDFQGACFRSGVGAAGDVWLACRYFDSELASHGWILDGPIKPLGIRDTLADAVPSVARARFSRSGVWLRLITSTGGGADNGGTRNEGAPVAVGYQVGRRSLTSSSRPDPDSVRYSLFRTKVTEENTFVRGYHVDSHLAELQRPSTSDAIGTNVVDFGVWLYRREPNGELLRIYPDSTGGGTWSVVHAVDFPVVADVMVRVLTEEGAAKVSAMERRLIAPPSDYADDDGGWWWSVVEAHSRVYTRRVEIIGGRL